MLSRFNGDDSGELTNLALDEMGEFVSAARGSVRWFIDARGGQNVAPAVSQAWTEWLAARAERFAGITALSTAPLFPLVLTVAKYRSGTDRLFRICREEETFRSALSAATSAQTAAAWM
jgi:hypothetical protein